MKLSSKIMLLALAAGSLTAGSVVAQSTRLIKPIPGSKISETKASTANPLLKRANATLRRISESDMEQRNLTLILKEDFSKMTEGTEKKPTDWTVNDEKWMCDDAYFNTPGWSGQGVFSAGGAVGLTYPGLGGTLNTPLGVYAGKLIIKFRAKAFKGESYLFVNVCSGGIMSPRQESQDIEAITLKEEEGWKDFIMEVTSYCSDDDGFIQFNGFCYRNGCLLDDIEIYRDNDFIWTPQNPKASNFVTDGFTANWSEVLGADTYLVGLVEEKISGTENIVGNVDFNSIDTSTGKLESKDVPEGWQFKLTSDPQVTADGGESGSSAIILASEDYVQLPVNGGSFLSFTYFAKPVSKGTDSGYLDIDVLDPATGNWKLWGYMSVDAFSKDGQTINLKDFEEQYPGAYDFRGLYTGVRLRTHGSKNPVIIDNIKFETTPAAERKTLLEDQATASTSYTFTGLDPEAEHYFTVKAKKGEMVSDATSLIHAFGISRPVSKDATDIDRRGGFTANWEYTPKANRYKVDVYSVDVLDADKEDAVMLQEDFANVKSATGTTAEPEEVGNYYDITPLDEYVGNPGWSGRGNIIVDGMIGCMQDNTGTFELYSPYMSLHNNNGKYKVAISVASVPGETFVVQGMEVYAVYEVQEEGMHKIAVELPGGVYQDRLMFYTLNGNPFLLDDIVVNQDLKKGDRLFSKIDNAEETGTDHRFSVDNSEISLFAYNLLAEHDAFGKTCRSEKSEMVYVEFNSGVSEIEGDGRITAVRSLPGAIVVALAQDATIEVFDLQGRKVADVGGKQGSNTVAVAPGFYVVRADGCAVKVIVK